MVSILEELPPSFFRRAAREEVGLFCDIVRQHAPLIEEWLAAADEAKAPSITTNNWLSSQEVLRFLERWTDDLGHPRARVRWELAQGEDEMLLATAFSGTPVRTEAAARGTEAPERSLICNRQKLPVQQRVQLRVRRSRDDGF